MATTTDIQQADHGGRRSGIDFGGVGDRRKLFTSSRRHTRMVKTLRVIFPAIAVTLCGFYVLAAYESSGVSIKKVMANLPQIVPGNLAMDNPRYAGFNSDGGSYVVTAAKARPSLTNLNLVDLEDITGDMVDGRDTKTRLKAKTGRFNSKKNILDLAGGIDVVSDSGMRAKLSKARVNIKKSTVETSDPVKVDMPAGSISAKSMRLVQKIKEATFTGDVVARLNPKPRTETAQDTQAGRSTTGRLLGTSGSPVDVTSNRLDVKQQEGFAVFTGNVKARQDAATLSSQELEVYFKNDGDAEAGVSDPIGGAQVTRIVSKHPVLMTNGAEGQMTGNGIEFDAAKETMLIVGNVVMTSGADRRVSGTKALIDSRANTATISGKVIVRQGESVIRGGQLYVDRAAGKSRLINSGHSAKGKAKRVTARLVQDGDGKSKKERGKQKRVKAKKQDGASGGVASIGAGSFKTTPGAPINIDAAQLDIDDKRRQAVFSGDVKATQGDFKIDSRLLTAYFSGPLGLLDEQGGGQGKQTAKLVRVRAQGDVRIKSSEGRSATGDWAEFDISKNTAVVGGEVSLVQGGSSVRGNRLTINMTTGAAVIDTAPGQDATGGWASMLKPGDADTKAKTGKRKGKKGKGKKKAMTPPGGIPIRGGRPSAVFFPQKVMGGDKAKQKKAKGSAKNEKKRAPEGDGANSNAASSWQPVTQPRP